VTGYRYPDPVFLPALPPPGVVGIIKILNVVQDIPNFLEILYDAKK
jgi:hypothetical protein